MRMKKDKRRPWRPAYDASMALCRYVLDENFVVRDGLDPCVVENRWHDVFCTVLKRLGFPRDARAYLWEELVKGNWRRLHLDEHEQRRTPEHWLGSLVWDCLYCSDRWSFDRLTRCHWAFRQYMRSATPEGTPCHDRWV